MNYFLKLKSLSCVRLFATPYTVAYRPPQSMEFSSKSTGVGCHFLFREYSQPRDQTWVTGRMFYPSEPPGKMVKSRILSWLAKLTQTTGENKDMKHVHLNTYSLAKRAEKSQKSKPRL